MSQVTGSAVGSSKNRLSAAEIPDKVDLLIALHLNLWPALTVAIQNGWGTSSPQVGADKRDWLAGAISELFEQKQLRDVDDLEEVLDQAMSDEFEVVVDDGTLEEVARAIWIGRERVLSGDATEVEELMARWESKKAKGGDKIVAVVQEEDDEDDSGDEEEWNGFDNTTLNEMDVDMDEAPALVENRQKPEPEIDEDGFTKVVSKKRK